uniref:Endonuclease/exonuclease/phosphatase domain-containing protein n=1 Tax=Timema shepardi TaxID=629360 RepID=A0A7R9ANY5_TIMSH|nr:unnamed protein product [Timema shepardi]
MGIPLVPFTAQDLNTLTARKNFFATGDLNCKHTHWNSRISNQAGRALSDHAALNNYVKPTFYPSNYRNLPVVLDVILTDSNPHLEDFHTLNELDSDHIPFFCRLLVNINPRNAFLRRNIPSTDWPKYQATLERAIPQEWKVESTEEFISETVNGGDSVWKITKQLKRSTQRTRTSAIHGWQGMTYTAADKAEAIAESLEDHFKPNSETQDENFSTAVKDEVNLYFEEPPEVPPPLVSKLEVEQVIRRLKKNKAPGVDRISNEMLCHAPATTIPPSSNGWEKVKTVAPEYIYRKYINGLVGRSLSEGKTVGAEHLQLLGTGPIQGSPRDFQEVVVIRVAAPNRRLQVAEGMTNFQPSQDRNKGSRCSLPIDHRQGHPLFETEGVRAGVGGGGGCPQMVTAPGTYVRSKEDGVRTENKRSRSAGDVSCLSAFNTSPLLVTSTNRNTPYFYLYLDSIDMHLPASVAELANALDKPSPACERNRGSIGIIEDYIVLQDKKRGLDGDRDGILTAAIDHIMSVSSPCGSIPPFNLTDDAYIRQAMQLKTGNNEPGIESVRPQMRWNPKKKASVFCKSDNFDVVAVAYSKGQDISVDVSSPSTVDSHPESHR